MLRRLPVTGSLFGGLCLATLILSALSEREQQRLKLLSSTNLHGLAAHPFAVLLASVFWSTPAGLAIFVAPATVVLGVVEWKIGSLRALSVAAAGHVGGTLLTASGIASGISLGRLPAAEAGAVDVGASYALIAALGFAVVLTDGRARLVSGVTMFAWLAPGTVLDRDFTSCGHLFAALIGISLAVGGLGRGRRSRPRLAGAIVAALIAAAPLTGYIGLYPAHSVPRPPHQLHAAAVGRILQKR